MRIASATEVGGAARLESAWLRAFGAGDRPRGWFARKLARERVDDELSQVAIAIDRDPRSPRSWRGFVLAGRPPSLGGAVRTAGTAVLPEARGQGIGRALLQAVGDAAARAGASTLELVADASTVPYYERLGFLRARDVATVRIDGSARVPARLASPVEWAALAEGLRAPIELAAWTPEAWTASTDRHTLNVNVNVDVDVNVNVDANVAVLVSREGHAWLVHRWLVQPGVHPRRAVLALSRVLPGPIVIPFVPAHAVSSITESGAPTRASILQRAALMKAAAGCALQPAGPRR